MKAHVRDGVAVNVCKNSELAKSFHPDVAALFEDVPNNVGVGWTRANDGTWSAPSPSDSDGPASPPPPG